jgi:signal transduction histidine kinase
MADFAYWLESHMPILIRAALAELSQDATQQLQAQQSVTEFFEGLLEAVRINDPQPIFAVLDAWVAARSAPTEGELTRLLPVVIAFKQVNADQICRLCGDSEAVSLLMAMETVYDPAIIYLSNLEADALLKDMRRQLRHAQNELDRLDKSKSAFIEVAAHELRTPITLVEGYNNMLATSIPGLVNDPMVGPLLDGINGGVKRLREIIRDMLDVSLISLGMIELHLQPVWLMHLMKALEGNMQPPLSERQVSLTIEYETIPRQPIFSDPERLLQVFQKIVYNAIKYTPDGGEIVVTARRLTGFIDIMVIDNGIGIDSDNLTRIFSTFSTLGDASLHSSGKAKFRGGGPGLGLFISKGIIEAHGGNIWAESPGYDEVNLPGSTFHIMIPMRSASADDKIMGGFDDIA